MLKGPRLQHREWENREPSAYAGRADRAALAPAPGCVDRVAKDGGTMNASSAMIASDLNPTLKTHERKIVRRQRHQKGSLQKRKGKRKMWVLLYREGGTRRFETLGAVSEMSKSEA